MPKRTKHKLLTPDEIISRLRDEYGEPQWRPHHDATAELVLTLLSQNTSDSNSGRAFSRLLQAFPDWQSVIEAPLPEVEEAIRPGGLAPTKAPRLRPAFPAGHAGGAGAGVAAHAAGRRTEDSGVRAAVRARYAGAAR